MDSFVPIQKRRQINLAPLIDVLFVIILFLALGKDITEQKALELNLPKSSTSSKVSYEPLTIKVDKNLRMVIGESEVPFSELSNFLASNKFDTTKPVLLLIDSSVTHGFNIGLMDVLRENGFYTVSFGTR